MRTAEAWLSLRQYDKAMGLLESSYQRLNESGEHWCLAEWLRLRGEYEHYAHGNNERAMQLFRQSIADAEERGALFWKLQSLRSLYRMTANKDDKDKIALVLQERPELQDTAEAAPPH